MMFIFQSAEFLGLIALALGIMLIVWAKRNEGEGIGLAKVFGWLIVILAIFGMLCSAYYSVAYWYKGYYQTPMGMSMMQSGSMMGSPGMNKMVPNKQMNQ